MNQIAKLDPEKENADDVREGKTQTDSSGESKWQLRLAVISTIATVLALIVPFVLPYFNKNDEGDKTAAPKSEDSHEDPLSKVKKTIEDIKKNGPKPPFPFPK